MQKLINISPKGFEFIDMQATPEQTNQMLNAQVAMQQMFIANMGDRLTEANRESIKYLEEN